MKRLVWVIVVIVNAAVSVAATADEWKLYRYPPDGFAAEFPTQPKPEPANADPTRIIRFNQYWSDIGSVAYGVAATLFLHSIIDSQPTDKTLDQAVEGVRGSLQCTIRSQRPVSMPSAAGRETIFDKCQKIPNLVAKERFYVVGDWLYQIMVLGTKSGVENDADTKRFLESFGLVAQ